MNTLDTAHATATGEGRAGHVKTDDGLLDVDLALPPGLGGSGDATNPEQLFAAGYAACFHSALKLMANKAKANPEGSTVTAHVDIGRTDAGGFGLKVTLDVEMPAVEKEQALSLVKQAHEVCPYSNATRGNIEVDLNVV